MLLLRYLATILHIMDDKTKHETMKPFYKVNIDFDHASKEWNKNKKRCGNGTYCYVCGEETKRGTPCQKIRTHGTNKCHIHKVLLK